MAGILIEHQIDTVVIGAIALAAHHYVRQAEDLDFGVKASLPMMRQLPKALRNAGFQTDLREPDMEDGKLSGRNH